MRALVVLATGLLLLVSFAGCTEKASDQSLQAKSIGGGRAPKAVNRTAIEERLNRSIATTGEEKPGDWFVLSASASPQGNLTGFRMGLHADALIPGNFGNTASVAMEVVPIVVGDPANLQEWALLPFILDGGRARFLSGDQFSRDRPYVIETPRKHSDLALPNPSQQEIPVSLAPRFASVSDTQLRAPGSLFFVVAARSASPVDFGLAIRLLDHRPQPSEKASPDLESFLEDVGRAVPFGIKKIGTGTGFVLESYETTPGIAGTQALSHFDTRSPGVRVEDRIAVRQVPGVEVRDTTVSSAFEAEQGWTYAYGFFSSVCATGKYQVRVEAHGKTFTPRGIIAQHIICGAIYGALVQGLLFGFIFEYTFSTGGPEGAKVSFEWQAHASLATIRYLHVSLGAPLNSLIGVTAADVQRASQGLVGNVPPGA